jgi:hypothetical protein
MLWIQTLSLYRMAVNVKICIVMDCTASMEPWIAQARSRMVQLVDNVRVQHPQAVLRVSFVGYRDYGDEEQLVLVPFLTAQETMARIQHVYAEGGDDRAEDVAHALFHAVHQDWSDADVKIVFHIADAPAHGEVFHDLTVSDRFPRGDPDGLDPRDFVEKLSFLDVHYTFVKIHHSTDTMVEHFHNCYAQGGSFSVVDLRPQGLARRWYDEPEGDPTILSEVLTRSISESITQHYTASQAL